MKAKDTVLWVVLAAISVARFFIEPRPVSIAGSYQAMAHFFVAALFGAWLVSKYKPYGIMVLVLTGVEMFAATVSRLR